MTWKIERDTRENCEKKGSKWLKTMSHSKIAIIRNFIPMFPSHRKQFTEANHLTIFQVMKALI